MIEVKDFNTISKEVLMILAYCDEDMINKIPNKFLKELINFAADSTNNFSIDPSKNLSEQNISEESKDLLAYIYFNYIADETEKEELKNSWNNNEIKYQENLKKIYSTNNLFKNNTSSQKNFSENNIQLIKYNQENFFIKLYKKIKTFFSH